MLCPQSAIPHLRAGRTRTSKTRDGHVGRGQRVGAPLVAAAGCGASLHGARAAPAWSDVAAGDHGVSDVQGGLDPSTDPSAAAPAPRLAPARAKGVGAVQHEGGGAASSSDRRHQRRARRGPNDRLARSAGGVYLRTRVAAPHYASGWAPVCDHPVRGLTARRPFRLVALRERHGQGRGVHVRRLRQPRHGCLVRVPRRHQVHLRPDGRGPGYPTGRRETPDGLARTRGPPSPRSSAARGGDTLRDFGRAQHVAAPARRRGARAAARRERARVRAGRPLHGDRGVVVGRGRRGRRRARRGGFVARARVQGFRESLCTSLTNRGQRARACVCMCVCVCVERERETMCVRERRRERCEGQWPLPAMNLSIARASCTVT
mmetsp:Transcript_56616/g.135162  ORF Transcript_56616/g.135162 Transcript_56616/m.135162 type:complete len:376 (+) Transcript_56616:44-1171(+)